jgi:cell division GTPase FtsZ
MQTEKLRFEEEPLKFRLTRTAATCKNKGCGVGGAGGNAVNRMIQAELEE